MCVCYIALHAHTYKYSILPYPGDVGGPLQELPIEQLIDIDTCRTEHFEKILSNMEWMSDTKAFCVRPTNFGKTCLVRKCLTMKSDR